MKVGDLVELSSTGKGIIYCRFFWDRMGIVVRVRTKKECMYPLVVRWFGKRKGYHGNQPLSQEYAHLRSQLKFVSRAKSATS